MPEFLLLQPAEVLNALGRADAYHDELDAEIQGGNSRLAARAGSCPWGDDSAGATFREAYAKSGGVNQLIEVQRSMARQCRDHTVRTRRAAIETRQTDLDQAERTRRLSA
ncbi:hypothetical protein Sru01_33360 [Sphaerisporangium rufum]|uniref:Uncharacterized protein n=1 Tax=Sphaerisporangium rufum TaxID=1381558 RepID=A0A919R275_9ACTN|nr:hypothetical protein [Sphaerisporangium rufum]GII78354.1 hypothetical protein Sru01_33360 [Sphaerisporangium rufum]